MGIPLDELIEAELTIVGSVGNPHVHLPALLSLVADGRLDPAGLVTERIPLEEAQRRARADDELRHGRIRTDRQVLTGGEVADCLLYTLHTASATRREQRSPPAARREWRSPPAGWRE